MAGREIARQWFIPGEGIDRHVISADIQRYLGNDATVRPGVGNGDHEGVQGYWIKAYRNLTSAMLSDLRADSLRWRQEQRTTGTREPYVGSNTYHASSAGRPDRRHGDSPSVEGPYGAPSTRERPRERLPPSSRGVDRVDRMDVDRMDIDPPPVAQPERRGYREPERGYQPERGAYPPERAAYPPERSAYPQDSRPPYQPEPVNAYPAGRPPVTTYAAQDPRYATSYAQPSDGAPPGYVRQGNYYVPVSTYEPTPAMPPSRSEPPQYANGPYAQPAAPGREAREPRYGGQPEYADPRYAYPSPATTTVSVSARDREPIASPPQPSPYGSMSSTTYDQYGRPVMSPPSQQERTMPSTREREPAYNPRERERTTVSSRPDDAHRSSRRRVQ